MREALVKASLREKPFREARNEVSLKEKKETSEAGGGVGTRARAEGIAAIGLRREGSTNKGAGMRDAWDT